jgi:hypothetical protein
MLFKENIRLYTVRLEKCGFYPVVNLDGLEKVCINSIHP